MASKQAIAAVRAAKNKEAWGNFATDRFLEKNHVPQMMWSIARWHEIGMRLRRRAAASRAEACAQYEAAVRIEAMERGVAA